MTLIPGNAAARSISAAAIPRSINTIDLLADWDTRRSESIGVELSLPNTVGNLRIAKIARKTAAEKCPRKTHLTADSNTPQCLVFMNTIGNNRIDTIFPATLPHLRSDPNLRHVRQTIRTDAIQCVSAPTVRSLFKTLRAVD